MCVGEPMQVLASGEHRARCRDRRGRECEIDLLLTGRQPVGAWLLTFLGAAREVIDADRADAVTRALDALDAVMRGEPADLDAAFADLLDHEPQLPDFLRGSSQ
ncbi:HypC/HybG/HupF family hydrogenase formation chaperone [Denitromonas ohlonensis]|uniref:HypC/HybG/HupF family hydrogenase formation chaperone n=2 Tax=Denitromonas TaxID=139331 RepID=A0A557RUC9_9RHOO|nr:HypC/HybG/HupF family hydrogenase formation chaperone [Denitromonas ohlonensis]TVO68764.1 HypC/HybG/HupF family hydrogenase formation chaperone [Denitromonas ohlonensis]TVO72870.1 HypC/HybG/HupF family hydrogenase formation chaperone [Denitromonas ohlonensis]